MGICFNSHVSYKYKIASKIKKNKYTTYKQNKLARENTVFAQHTGEVLKVFFTIGYLFEERPKS